MACIVSCHFIFNVPFPFFREESEIIEGEVVEIQIDRPATGVVQIHFVMILRIDVF